uniref:Erythema protein SVEP-7 n=1 Tax=Simulium vittatum TaxID=7192 RepID=B5M0W5_SIMVI|nr:erythema protein SVEP-7 [Simulium vittatum]
MRITQSIIVPTLAIFGAAAADVIANNNCIVISDNSLVMHERQPDQEFPHYVYMKPKGDEDKDQQWILESTDGKYYKLKNKSSERYLGSGTFDYFLTVAGTNSDPDQYMFTADETGKYDISSKENGHLRSRGSNYGVMKDGDQHFFTVENCKN